MIRTVLALYVALSFILAAEPDEVDPSIVNGRLVDQGDNYDWIVRMSLRINNAGRFQCTGSLIQTNPPVILTAAHCVDILKWDESKNDWYSRRFDSSGSIDWFIGSQGVKLTTRDSTSRIVMHQQYGASLSHDIALVFFDNLADADKVSNIEVPRLATYEAGECCNVDDEFTVLGYGATSDYGGNSANNLYATVLRYVSLSTCNQYYANRQQDTMCMIGTDTGVCQGDSGGPVLQGAQTDGTGRIIYGVNSFTHVMGCASGVPDGAASVSNLRQWIDFTLSINGYSSVYEQKFAYFVKFVQRGSNNYMWHILIVVLLVAGIMGKKMSGWCGQKEVAYQRIPDCEELVQKV